MILCSHHVQRGNTNVGGPEKAEQGFDLGSEFEPPDKFLLAEFFCFSDKQESGSSMILSWHDDKSEQSIEKYVWNHGFDCCTEFHEELGPEVQLHHSPCHDHTLDASRMFLGQIPDQDRAQRDPHEMGLSDLQVIDDLDDVRCDGIKGISWIDNIFQGDLALAMSSQIE